MSEEHAGPGQRAITRSLGSPVLFAIVYVSLASGVYFSLGVVAGHALGLTPVVFLVAAFVFALAAMTYVEGASLHQDRGGSTIFARYAFNELWSFIAGWAVLLDYVILIAVTALAADHYLAVFWHRLDSGALETLIPLAIIVLVAVGTIRGFSPGRAQRVSALVVVDLLLQLIIIIAGLATFFRWHVLVSPIHLGSAPEWRDVVFAIGVATVVLTGLESAAGLAGETRVGRAGLKRLVTSATASVALVYVGIALVAMTALPVVNGRTELSHRYQSSPALGIAEAFHQSWLRHGLRFAIAVTATATLIAAANSAMLGLSRLAYSLSTNRQIPSALGRLHPTRGTPFVLIVIGAIVAFALVIPHDLDFLVGIYAFGALLGLTIAHASIVVLRFREPERDRPYRVPLNVRVRGADVPIPAVVGAVLSFAVWVSVVIFHHGARYVGFGWLLGGLVLYVVYRTTQDKSIFKRVVVAEAALRSTQADARSEAEYGSILVPLFGSPLDDDIIQTAGRLAGDEHDDFDDESGATIEALWVFEVPMSLPIDARLPDEQLKRARAALARAKAVGEEYEGVEVATATVRARRAGQAIVEEAKRRGVEAIVLAADEPSRIRSGPRLGGRSPLDNFVGEVTKYVVAKADCQVILTAPAAGKEPRPGGATDPQKDGHGLGTGASGAK